MEKNKDILIDELIKKISLLPPDRQKTVCFVIDNFEIIKKMCENSGITPEEMKKRIKQANETDDYVLSALLYAAQIFDDNYTEND